MISAIAPWVLDASALLFLGQLAVVSCAAYGVGLVAVRWGRRRSLPLQHALLLAALCLSLFSPVLLLVSTRCGWGQLPVPINAAAAETDAADAANLPAIPGSATNNGMTLSAALVACGGTLLAGVWACGTAVLGLRLLRSLRNLLRLRAALRAEPDARLQATTDAALRSLGVTSVPVCQSPLAPAPLALGLLRPLIVVPAGLERVLAPDQLDLVLRHEGAHLCRRDPVVALLQAIATTLFWWNPLLGAVNTALARLREQLCDEMAVGSSGQGRRLAEALLHVAEWCAGRRQPILGAASLLDDGPQELEARIVRLLQPHPRPATRLGRCELAFVVGLALVVTGIAVAVSPYVAAPQRAAETGLGGNYDPTERGYHETADRNPDAAAAPYAGSWLMSLPAGFQHRITLTPVGSNRYRLAPNKLNSSGIYEVQGDRLVIVAPNDRRLLGFVWEVQSPGRMLLIGQPPISKTGSNYLRATLTR
jgi:beta-lactamase regulating signal transducer with metallopeptidase domain